MKIAAKKHPPPPSLWRTGKNKGFFAAIPFTITLPTGWTPGSLAAVSSSEASERKGKTVPAKEGQTDVTGQSGGSIVCK
jgi:hypothetical protein